MSQDGAPQDIITKTDESKDSLQKVRYMFSHMFSEFYGSEPYTAFRKHSNSFFSSAYGIIFTGAFIGVVAAFLQHEGNPGNMGFCVACFERDIAGALGLHNAGVVQYLRPEILAFVLGSFVASIMFREYRARTGSAPIIRFIFGFFAMIGALVFLGCPWRALIRLGGGDLNAVLGLLGLVAGVGLGSFMIKRGFNLGRNRKTFPVVGLVMPGIAIILLVFLLWDPKFDEGTVKVLKESAAGPGAQHAAIWLSFSIAFLVGFFAQRSRFCTIAGIRDTILIKDIHLLIGVIALLVAVFVTNLVYSQFELGFDDQPVAHNFHVWNFMGMVLAGLGFTLAGGCPGRQLILSGEGDADASVFVIGMVAGAAFSHNFRLASSPGGPGDWGPAAVIVGLILLILIGWTMRERV